MSISAKRRYRPQRLVCVVEGKGEVQAIPNLCSRILTDLGATLWVVDQEPVKQPRSRLVDGRQKSPLRGPRSEYLEAAVEMARRRPADAVLVLCDSDDDCPATWGPAASVVISRRVRGTAVMIVREYESWLVAGRVSGSSISGRQIDQIRDAKKLLAQFIPGYKPTVHQLAATRDLDIAKLRMLSRSFDKLVRALASLTGKDAGPRPLLA